MKTIRIAAGAGYAGDRIKPALNNISKGKIDYIIFECLAERTIALAQKEKLENPDRGYNHLLECRQSQLQVCVRYLWRVAQLRRQTPLRLTMELRHFC